MWVGDYVCEQCALCAQTVIKQLRTDDIRELDPILERLVSALAVPDRVAVLAYCVDLPPPVLALLLPIYAHLRADLYFLGVHAA